VTRSPTLRFLLGLLLTLGAVTGLSSYALYRLHGVRRDELKIIDLNRHDSLQLLRVQNDLIAIGLVLRDMNRDLALPRLQEYRDQFDRLKQGLRRAENYESKFPSVAGRLGQKAALGDALKTFWETSDAVFVAAERGSQKEARDLISGPLLSQQVQLARQVSSLLERNNAAETEADNKIADIYEGAEKDIYIFLAGTMLSIAATSLYLIYWNRKFFWQLESLSRQRRVLAARLIDVQEEVLRSVSRELHDEFGQILTAVGAMLSRAEKKGLPANSPLRTELSEVREITHGTLEKIRGLSQMLHPAVIDDYGLAKAVEWYAEVFERQTGVQATVSITGEPLAITGQPAIHCFRIVQEALTNAAKHSGTARAEITIAFGSNQLEVSIRDFGRGLTSRKKNSVGSGLGLIAMRERAELLNGKLNITSTPEAGTTVSLFMPFGQEDNAGQDDAHKISENDIEEVFSKQND
jgi:signal transduction histidine kinase